MGKPRRISLGPIAIVAGAVTTTVLVVMPVCLLGASGLLIRKDLGFAETQLGLVVGAFYAASATTAFLVGRHSVAERLGVGRALTAGLVLAIVSSASTAWLADSWQQVAVFVAIAGAANGLAQPAANLALARRVPESRLGLAFGVKQASIPAATLVAGLAVPLVALTVGWRWAFGATAGASVLLLIVIAFAGHSGSIAQEPPGPEGGRQRLKLTGFLLRTMVATALGSLAVNAMRIFFVESAVAKGEKLWMAALILSVASCAGVISRLFGGWRTDHNDRDPLTSAGVMMLIGACGYATQAFVSGTLPLLCATVAAISAGWGYSGLLQLGVVKAHEETPGAASGIVHSGELLGSLIGPLIFGVIVVHGSYAAAWWSVAIVGAAGGVMLLCEPRRPRVGSAA